MLGMVGAGFEIEFQFQLVLSLVLCGCLVVLNKQAKVWLGVVC
jgi:hypothetical protein